jgi:hypothetical protein
LEDEKYFKKREMADRHREAEALKHSRKRNKTP